MYYICVIKTNLIVLVTFFENLLSERMKPILKENSIILLHQLSFREQYSTIQNLNLLHG